MQTHTTASVGEDIFDLGGGGTGGGGTVGGGSEPAVFGSTLPAVRPPVRAGMAWLAVIWNRP